MNKLAIGLIIASMVLFPFGLITANRPIAVIGVLLIGSGALIGALVDMHKRQKSVN